MSNQLQHDAKLTQHDLENLYNLSNDALNYAKKLGASDCEINLSRNQGYNLQVRQANIDTVEFSQDQASHITVYFGTKNASASCTDLNKDAIFSAIDKACEIVKFIREDKYCGIAAKEALAQDLPNLQLYNPWELNVNDATKLAIACEQDGLNYDPQITNSEGVNISNFNGVYAYANSNGFCGGYLSSHQSISCCLIASDHQQNMQRDYYYTQARHHSKLADPKYIAEQAAQRSLARLNPQSMPSQACPAILLPQVARSFISIIIQAISGSNLYRKSSFLLDKLEQEIAATHLNIIEDPLIPQALGSKAFDNDGVSTCKKDILKNGVLATYLLSTYSARRLNMQSTANAGGIGNIILASKNTLPFNELLKNMYNGVIISETMGHGINLVTGDYSYGANGFLVKNGIIQHAIEEITIAGNIKDLLQQISAIGSDFEHNSKIVTGSLLIDNMTIAAK